MQPLHNHPKNETTWYRQRETILGLRFLHSAATVLCFFSLLVFSVATKSNGGHEKNGKYYLGYKRNLREVSREEFQRDQIVRNALFFGGMLLAFSFMALDRVYYSRAKQLEESENRDEPFS